MISLSKKFLMLILLIGIHIFLGVIIGRSLNELGHGILRYFGCVQNYL